MFGRDDIPSSPGRTSQRAACAGLILFHHTWNCHHAPPDGTRHTHFTHCGPGHLALWDSVPRHGKHPISTKKPHLTPRSRRTAPSVSPRHASQCPHCQATRKSSASSRYEPSSARHWFLTVPYAIRTLSALTTHDHMPPALLWTHRPNRNLAIRKIRLAAVARSFRPRR
jgi:hypothetical protein